MTGENKVIKQLRAVACKLTSDYELQKDLVQEMFVHLVQVQANLPGRTSSWYIKSCEFHARNYLKLGRSIDSHKRSRNRVVLGTSYENRVPKSEDGVQIADPIDVHGEVITNDVVDHILPHLSDTQQQTLFLLMKGFGVREVARQLGISHPAVIKHRKKIARVAAELMREHNVAVGGNDSNGNSLSQSV